MYAMECIKNIGISTMGYGKNLSEAKKALKIEKNGISISFLNFAENEFYPAGISSPGFSPIDYFENPRQVRREKENSDFVFVFLHAGNEHCPFPRDGIKKFCHTLVDSGADGVIISHPHCPQGFEYYNAKPIAYSTGNFFMSNFSDKISRWNIGYMADITIKEDKSIILSPVPYEFTPSCDSFRFLTGSKKDSFIKYLNSLSKIITETPQEEYQNLLYAWSIMYMRTMADFIENAKADALFNGEYMLFIKNAFSCESHSEVMKNYFTALTQNRLESFEKYIKKIETLQEMPF